MSCPATKSARAHSRAQERSPTYGILAPLRPCLAKWLKNKGLSRAQQADGICALAPLNQAKSARAHSRAQKCALDKCLKNNDLAGQERKGARAQDFFWESQPVKDLLALLARLASKGVRLGVVDGQLSVRSTGPLSPADRAALKRLKPDLLILLENSNPQDARVILDPPEFRSGPIELREWMIVDLPGICRLVVTPREWLEHFPPEPPEPVEVVQVERQPQ